MAKSLAGGLLPLGPRSGSSTAVSSSALTGGLIPLGNKSRPSVGRDDQEESGWGGVGSRWSGKEDDSGLEEERLGSEAHPDKRGKKLSSSRKKRGGKEKSDRAGHQSSKSSARRRRGSKESSKDALDNDSDASPSIAGLESRRNSRKEGWESGSTLSNLNPVAAVDVEEPEDDSYLFLGATAGAKGKKSSRESAQEQTLNYDSTDSFGLPKKKTSKERALYTAPKPGNTGSESRTTIGSSSPHTDSPSITTNAGEKRGSQQDDGSLSFLGGRQVQRSSSSGLALDPAVGSLGGNMPLSTAAVTSPAGGGRGASRVPPDEAPAVTTATEIDLDEDFDSPDGMDALLEMTDPSSLMPEPSGAAASATGPMPPLLPHGGSTSPGRQDGKNPPHNQLHPPGATPPPASSVSTSKRMSPSPPSSPRKGRSDVLKDSRSGQPLPSRPGWGLTLSGSRDGLSYGGASEERMGSESGKVEGRALQDSNSGGGEPRVTNAVAEGTQNNAALATTTSPTRALLSRARTDGEESRAEEDGISGGAGNEGEEKGSLEHGSAPEASASVASASAIVGDFTGSLGSVGGASDARRQLTSSGPGIVKKSSDLVPRRSALAGTGKPTSQSRKPKSRGVTFDDDLVGVDTLDILPGGSSDEGEELGGGTPPTEDLLKKQGLPQSSLNLVPTKSPVPVETAAETIAEGHGNSGGVRDSEHRTSEPWSTAAASSGISRRPSTSITEGLSPATALLMADSSSEDNNSTIAAGVATAKSRPGLEHPDRSSFAVPRLDLGRAEVEKKEEGSEGLFGVGPTDGGTGKDESIDDAKLDLALGFTPSAMEGSRKPRRTLPAGRRRRSRRGESSTAADGENEHAGVSVANSSLASMPSIAIPMATARPAETTFERTTLSVGRADDAGSGVAGIGERAGDNGSSRSTLAPGVSPTLPVDVREPTKSSTGATAFGKTPVTAAATKGTGMESTPSSAERVPSAALPGSESDRALDTRALTDSRGALGPFDHGSKNGSSNKDRLSGVAAASSSRSENSAESRGVDVSVLASLERQLALLASEKEAVAAKVARDEQRFQRDADLARDATAAAQTRAFESEAALAAARARISQLEAEAAEHTVRLAAVESRSASDLRAEQESCLKKISDAEARHQASAGSAGAAAAEDLRKAERRQEEALSELKRLHREELEDTRRRNSASKTLETLAEQVSFTPLLSCNVSGVCDKVQASAGAVKLLQSEMIERKNVSEVSREGHMDARERLIKELEQSARRAQQTAEDEVQRLQGTLMAMDQGAMVAEVDSVRKSVEEERQRLAERGAALERDKREADATARAESDRLAEQAAEEMARRHADEEGRLNLARQSLEKEASSFEARLSCARADLHKADHVRKTLDRLRDQDEVGGWVGRWVERRRLKAVAGELERAFEEVRAKTDESIERQREAEAMKMEALAASKTAAEEREAAQLRSVRTEEAARRLEAERSSIAQASHNLQSCADMSLGEQAGSGRGGGGDTGGGGSVVVKVPGLPTEATLGLAGNPTSTGGIGLPFTGIAAAEATLQAICSAPPFPGLDMGRELGRLARRAADIRECTREQSSFLLSSRAARFSPAPLTVSDHAQESKIASDIGGLEGPGPFPGDQAFLSSTRRGSGSSREIDAMIGQQVVGGISGAEGHDLGALGIGLSSAVLEELDKIERACSQRSLALKEEEQFLETIGRTKSPVSA
ncbi:unnamed protein product [Ectocarpus sp. CCAP 1310/34]|nr:unnamed protein product [Ectocarpus sp. CCAP 1310/34]